MLGIIAHREGGHQRIPVEDQVSQALQVRLSNGT